MVLSRVRNKFRLSEHLKFMIFYNLDADFALASCCKVINRLIEVPTNRTTTPTNKHWWFFPFPLFLVTKMPSAFWNGLAHMWICHEGFYTSPPTVQKCFESPGAAYLHLFLMLNNYNYCFTSPFRMNWSRSRDWLLWVTSTCYWTGATLPLMSSTRQTMCTLLVRILLFEIWFEFLILRASCVVHALALFLCVSWCDVHAYLTTHNHSKT